MDLVTEQKLERRARILQGTRELFGQLYLTILVARLIGVHLAQARRSAD